MSSTVLVGNAAGAGVRAQPRAARPRRRRAIYSIVLGLIAWELIGRFLLTDRILFAPFSQVMVVLWELTASGEIWSHLRASGTEFFLGFGLAAAFGITVGALMGRFAIVRDYADPWVSILYSSPLVALMPFYLLLFGVGLVSKIAIVFTVSVFPILLNTYVGITSTERNHLDVARAFCCGRWQTFVKVEFPSALPFIITGLRLGLGRGLTGVVVGEMFSARAGLGYLIASAGQSFDAAKVLAGVLLFTISGYAMMSFLTWLGQRLAPWRQSTDAR